MGSWRRYSSSRVFGLLRIFIPIGGCGLADQIIYLNAAPREVPYSNTDHCCTDVGRGVRRDYYYVS